MSATVEMHDITVNEGKQKIGRFDDVIEEAGGFGFYQIIISFMYVIPRMFVAFLTTTIVFAYSTPDHRCALPTWPNDTFIVRGEEHKMAVDSAIPPIGPYHKCHLFVDPSYNSSLQGAKLLHNPNGTKRYKKCDKWVYDQNEFDNTIISEFNLFCDNYLVASYAKMLFLLGNFLGAIVIGIISDKYGRRWAAWITSPLTSVACLALYFAERHLVILILLPLTGAVSVGGMVFSAVAMVEILPKERRIKPGILFLGLFSLGMVLAVPAAYASRDWRTPFLIASIFTCLYTIASFWLPESARWLLSNGCLERAEHEVRRMARYNGVTLASSFSLEHVLIEKKERQTRGQLIKNRRIRENILILCITWFVQGLVIFGLMINAVNMVGNIFLNSLVTNLASVASFIFVYFLLDKIGRARFLSINVTFCGIVLLLTIFPVFFGGKNAQFVTLGLAVLGRLAARNTCCATIYMAVEIFPTNVRASVLSMAPAISRFGSMLAPYIADMSVYINATYGQALPLAVFGASAVVSAVLILRLPDTTKTPLPDTVGQGEMLLENNLETDNEHNRL